MQWQSLSQLRRARGCGTELCLAVRGAHDLRDMSRNLSRRAMLEHEHAGQRDARRGAQRGGQLDCIERGHTRLQQH
eukprot:303428-Prymnesium_polylepis.1